MHLFKRLDKKYATFLGNMFLFADLSLEEVLSGFKTTGVVLRLIFFMVFPET